MIFLWLAPLVLENGFLMKKIVLAILFYVIACWLILTIHSLSPTNMAGPGLDIVVYFVSVIVTVAFLVISLIKLRSGNKLSYLNLFINLAGTLIIIIFLYRELTKTP